MSLLWLQAFEERTFKTPHKECPSISLLKQKSILPVSKYKINGLLGFMEILFAFPFNDIVSIVFYYTKYKFIS